MKINKELKLRKVRIFTFCRFVFTMQSVWTENLSKLFIERTLRDYTKKCVKKVLG